MHRLEDLHQVRRVVQLLAERPREGDDPDAAMVDEVDKHLVRRRALQHGVALGGGRRVAREHGLEVGRGDVLTLVVDLAARIHVLTRHALRRGRVEELARERVLLRVGDVVVEERDDVGSGDASSDEDLVPVAHVRVVAVVHVPVRAANQDREVVRRGGDGEQRRGEEEEELRHGLGGNEAACV